MNEREVGKIEKYKVLKDEIAGKWGMKEVIVIPVVVGALGAISTGFEKYIAPIGIEMRVEHAQKTTLLGTARILSIIIIIPVVDNATVIKIAVLPPPFCNEN